MNAQDISLTSLATDDQKKFCKLWPDVKAGLALLAGIIKNPIAKGAIQLVITAGDTISSRICGVN